MKISINETEIVVNKDYSGATIRGSQDYGFIYVDLHIYDLVIDHKAFEILDAAFRNGESVNVKLLDNGFDRDLNMFVRGEDIVVERFSDNPTSSFDLECHR